MHHVLGSDIDFCQVTSLKSHGQAPLQQSAAFNWDGWLLWMPHFCLPRMPQQPASATRGEAENSIHCRYKLHFAQSLWGKKIVHSDVTARKSPCGADFCPTWQNFICMIMQIFWSFMLLGILCKLQSHLELLYPFSPKEVFPPHDSFHSMANKRGM